MKSLPDLDRLSVAEKDALIRAQKEYQIRDLLDIGDRIGDTAGPEDIGDVIKFSAQLLIHMAYS
jgi:hypothetical protein